MADVWKLKPYTRQVIVEEDHGGRNRETAFANVESDTAVALSQLDVTERDNSFSWVNTPVNNCFGIIWVDKRTRCTLHGTFRYHMVRLIQRGRRNAEACAFPLRFLGCAEIVRL